jgi:hypothetical protein
VSAILKPADLEPVSRSELETVKARARDGCAPRSVSKIFWSVITKYLIE